MEGETLDDVVFQLKLRKRDGRSGGSALDDPGESE